MAGSKKRNGRWLLAALLAGALLGACGGKKTQTDLSASAEPDKVLYERALEDIRKGRHTVGRLTLQTLINTYPDSEYLAKAKLAIADSYFKEGGTAGLTQAVGEYKDFITFFPFLDEAPYAQMQIGLANYRRMEKPDRDRTQAQLAEEEFQAFLLKYADHPLAPQAEQRLREVQEVLAEGDFRIARYYYIKGSLRAATARLLGVVDRYPLYSQADRALWMLADSYERAEKSELATSHYARIVRDYPLSDLVEDAKQKLIKLGAPVPQPDPAALARMQRERDLAREKPGILRRSLGLFKSGPDVSVAARTGKPNLSPAGEGPSPTETLTAGGNLSVGAGGSGSSVVVETVPPGSAGNPPPTPSTNPPAASAENPKSDPAASAQASKDPDKNTESDDKKKKKEKESSSKKKKGLRKIIPW